MTTTNQAFIKAYRTDGAQAAPNSPALEKVAAQGSPAARGPSVGLPTIARRGERSALYGTTQEQEDTPSDVTSAIATRSASVATAAERSVVDEVFRVRKSHKIEDSDNQTVGSHTAAKKRPLSSFIATTGIARLSKDPGEGDFFRPGTTVASFQWPEVNRILSRNCRQQLGAVTNLLIAHGDAGRSLLGVIGMTPSQGASTIATCIASQLARAERRVILVDANFRRPRLAHYLEAEPTSGWQDVLKHGASLPDAAVRATQDRVDLLALVGKMPSDPQKLAGGLQAVVTAGVLRHAYDHVVIDLGAFRDAGTQTVALDLARNMGLDIAILVTGTTSRDEDVAALTHQLNRCGCELLGAIQNRAHTPNTSL